MKRILLLETTIHNPINPNGITLKYKDEFKRAVETYPEGCVISEMKSAMRIIDVLDSTPDGDYLYLEDTDFNYLKSRVSTLKYTIAARELIEMVEALNNAETVTNFQAKSSTSQ